MVIIYIHIPQTQIIMYVTKTLTTNTVLAEMSHLIKTNGTVMYMIVQNKVYITFFQ